MNEMRCPHCGKINQDLAPGTNTCLRCGKAFTAVSRDRILEIWTAARPKYGDRPCTRGITEFVLDVLAEADRIRAE